MSNNYASCFNRIDFVVMPSYIELPWINQEKKHKSRRKHKRDQNPKQNEGNKNIPIYTRRGRNKAGQRT